jgi:hypothetical protein
VQFNNIVTHPKSLLGCNTKRVLCSDIMTGFLMPAVAVAAHLPLCRLPGQPKSLSPVKAAAAAAAVPCCCADCLVNPKIRTRSKLLALQLYSGALPDYLMRVGVPYQVQLALPMKALAEDPSSSSSSSSSKKGNSSAAAADDLADNPMIISTWNETHAHTLYSVHWRMLAGSKLVRLELDWQLLSQGFISEDLLERDCLPCLRQLLLCMPDVGEIWKCLGKKAVEGLKSKDAELLPEWLADDQQQQQGAGVNAGTSSSAKPHSISSSSGTGQRLPRSIAKGRAAAAHVLQRRHRMLLACWRVLLQRGLDRLELKGPCLQGPGWGPEAVKQREASWFVGQLAEMLVVLRELQSEQQQQQQQQQQQHRVPLRELVLMDAAGAPCHMRWLLLGDMKSDLQDRPAGSSNSSSSDGTAGTAGDKLAASSSSAVDGESGGVYGVDGKLAPSHSSSGGSSSWPLLLCISRVVFDGCSCITAEVVREYMAACATPATAAVDEQGGSTGGRVRSGKSQQQQQQQQQHLVLRRCSGLQGVALTERDGCSMAAGSSGAVQLTVETRGVET